MYGQTGAGKTYTMIGNIDESETSKYYISNQGVMQQTLGQIFESKAY